MYRILMIAPTSFFSDYGGHIRMLEEARALQELGHRVTIVTYYLGQDPPDLEIIRTRPTPWRADYEVGSSLHKVAFDIFLGWTGLKTVLRRRFDIVHGHMHEGAFIGYFLSRLMGWGSGQLEWATFEFGTAYIAGAGLLNFLVALDAYDIAAGKKS